MNAHSKAHSGKAHYYIFIEILTWNKVHSSKEANRNGKYIALHDMCGKANFTNKQNFPFNVGDKHESVVQKGVLG